MTVNVQISRASRFDVFFIARDNHRLSISLQGETIAFVVAFHGAISYIFEMKLHSSITCYPHLITDYRILLLAFMNQSQSTI